MTPMSPTATRTSHELDVYGKRGITLVRGSGARLWDDTGREYIDCMSAHGAAILGHAHPRIAEALERQARTLTSCPGSFYHPGKEKLIERLAERFDELAGEERALTAHIDDLDLGQALVRPDAGLAVGLAHGAHAARKLSQ